jgi:hypothetical protein
MWNEAIGGEGEKAIGQHLAKNWEALKGWQRGALGYGVVAAIFVLLFVVRSKQSAHSASPGTLLKRTQSTKGDSDEEDKSAEEAEPEP